MRQSQVAPVFPLGVSSAVVDDFFGATPIATQCPQSEGPHLRACEGWHENLEEFEPDKGSKKALADRELEKSPCGPGATSVTSDLSIKIRSSGPGA